MSHAVSSSDSEDDGRGGSTTPQKSQEQSKRVSKYQCPPDFVSYEYSSGTNSLLDRSDHTELWLIKAPARFDPENLAGLKVSLSGLEMIQSTAGEAPQIYSVLGSGAGPADLRVLTSSSKKDQDVPFSASGFAGLLSISESYGDCSGNQGPIAIPAAPAPSIPPGLRQRFQPFGSSTLARTVEDTASASPSPSKRAWLNPEESGEQTKKKKKKKREKHSIEESAEVAHIKQEVVSFESGELQTPEPAEEEGMVEKRKKKKVKKEKERGDRLHEVAADISAALKEEPTDILYGETDSPAKKKKKKKKTHDE
ncbi:DNA-directed RNA polymerase I subunit RPA34 [Salminus brasiliensis]|uniref:DNA-directed RNA polymerase I subunit RPA34 n=1 Tax=Salminus brasiliensis TaxID=930266 RepID=UPI003B836DE8